MAGSANSNVLLTSLHGKRIGLSPGRRLLVDPSGTAPRAVPLVLTAEAASTAVSNTTTETLFDNYLTIPANTLEKNSLIQIRYQGIATTTNSSDTLAVKLYIGGLAGTALISEAATDVADSNVFTGEYELIIRTIGSSGTMVGVGSYKSIPAAEGTMTIKDDILASTTVDTTADQKVSVSATWSAASANDSVRLDFLRAIVH